jgi:hypothetical protein
MNKSHVFIYFKMHVKFSSVLFKADEKKIQKAKPYKSIINGKVMKALVMQFIERKTNYY